MRVTARPSYVAMGRRGVRFERGCSRRRERGRRGDHYQRANPYATAHRPSACNRQSIRGRWCPLRRCTICSVPRMRRPSLWRAAARRSDWACSRPTSMQRATSTASTASGCAQERTHCDPACGRRRRDNANVEWHSRGGCHTSAWWCESDRPHSQPLALKIRRGNPWP